MIEPETQVAGGIVLLDMDGLSLKQAYQFSPSIAKRIVDWLQVSCFFFFFGFTEIHFTHFYEDCYLSLSDYFTCFWLFLNPLFLKRKVYH